MRQRCEYRYDDSHPAYQLLQQQSVARGVPIQRVIHEAVLEWYTLKHSLTIPPVDDDPPVATAHAMVDEWM